MLAFVGARHIHAPGFVRLLAERGDVRVKWVWDHDPARAKVRAADLRARGGASLDEIVSDPEVQGVVICSETDRHPELVAAAAKAGKHMFVEKPLGITAEGSLEMAAAIDEGGAPLHHRLLHAHGPEAPLPQGADRGRQLRHASPAPQAWNVHAGSLGGWFDEKPGDPANTWRWMADPKVAGVGAFGDLGTHSLDILMWLLGDVKAVSADIRVVTGRYGDCDETGTSLHAASRAGSPATLTAGWVDIANPVTLVIAGTEGQAVVVNGTAPLRVEEGRGLEPRRALDRASPRGRGRRSTSSWTPWPAGDTGQPLVTPGEAAARVVVMEAAYDSARTRRWVSVST